MVDFLQRVLNAHIVVTLLAGAAACGLRVGDLISGAECVDVLKTCLWAFIGGGLLKEGMTAFANKGSAT